MKKIFSFVVILGILIFIFQFFVIFFKDSHLVDYELKINKYKISINEEYIKKNGEDYYLFKVNIDNNSFVFDVDNKFNKQKKVIENFKIHEKNDLICISPIYIKSNDEPIVVCNIDRKQNSYISVKDKYDIDDFLNTLDNFNFDKYNSSNNTITIGNLSVYRENLYDDENLIVYDYSDLIKSTATVNRRIKFSNYDVYNNEMGILIDKYYILPNFENKPEYSGFLVIDITNENKKIIKFDKPISTNLYINGVVDNKLYFLDKSNLKQYELDPVKNNYRIVGDKKTNAQYYDGNWSTRNIYDFYKQELKFNKLYPIKDNYVKAFETNKYYYYYNSKNEFYKVYKQQLDNPIFLFQYKDIKEVKVVDDHIYFMNSDIIYRYDDNGLKKIVKSNEFKYNYENIYSVYFK